MNDWRVQAVQQAIEKLEQNDLKFIPGQQFTRDFILSNDDLLREFNAEEFDSEELDELIQEKVDELETFISINHNEQFKIIFGHRWLKASLPEANVNKKPLDEQRVAIDQEVLKRLLSASVKSWTSDDAHDANRIIELLSQSGEKLDAKTLAIKVLEYAENEQKSVRELIDTQEKLATLSENLGTEDATEHYYKLAELEWKNEQYSDAQAHFKKAVTIGEKHYKKLCKDREKDEKNLKEFERTLLLLYRRARKLAREEGNSKTNSRLYVKECKLQCRKEKRWYKRLAKQVYGITANHGESPWRVGFWGIASIFLFALLYCWVNADLPPPEQGGNQFCVGFKECAYYSTVTFSTLGYGELVPTDPLARFIASIQALLGLIMTSLFIATFFKRYSRE